MKVVLFILSLFAFPTVADAQWFNANNPAASGYALVYDSDFRVDTIATVDVNDTRAPGFNWYVHKFPAASGTTATSSNLSVSGGALNINPPGGDTSNWQIATATPLANSFSSGVSNPTVGNSFSNGWYIEASIQYLTANVQNGIAFWAENLYWLNCPGAGCLGRQWPGQSIPYDQWVEDDIFEWYTGAFTSTTWNQGLIDWYGASSKIGLTTDPNNTPGIDHSLFHRYGQLWIPGNSDNGYVGTVQPYFDGSPSGTPVQWTDPVPAAQMPTSYPSPPPSGTDIGAWMDSQSMVVIIGGEGPFSVQYVQVWQTPNCP